MRVVAAEKSQTISVDTAAACVVAGDVDQLRRLLFNLLDNAIKYTPANGSDCGQERVPERGGACRCRRRWEWHRGRAYSPRL